MDAGQIVVLVLLAIFIIGGFALVTMSSKAKKKKDNDEDETK